MPLSLFRRSALSREGPPLSHFSAQSTDGRVDGRIVLLFSCSLSEWVFLFLSFSPHIEAHFPTRFRTNERGHSPGRWAMRRLQEKDVICAAARRRSRALPLLSSKWKKNRTMGEFGQRQIIDLTQVVKSLQLLSRADYMVRNITSLCRSSL